MATQDIMTEAKGKKNEFISLKIRNDITFALHRLLDTPEVTYEVISYTDNKEAKTDSDDLIGSIMLVNDQTKIVFPHTVFNHEHLVYNNQQPREYTVWISESKVDARFLYGWKGSFMDRFYVIAPYFVSPDKEDNNVFCSYTLDVTDAVRSTKPREALTIRLEQLANRSNKELGFNNDMYHWDRDGGSGDFIVRRPNIRIEGPNLWHWKAELGDMVLTTNVAKMARLKFSETSGPIP